MASKKPVIKYGEHKINCVVCESVLIKNWRSSFNKGKNNPRSMLLKALLRKNSKILKNPLVDVCFKFDFLAHNSFPGRFAANLQSNCLIHFYKNCAIFYKSILICSPFFLAFFSFYWYFFPLYRISFLWNGVQLTLRKEENLICKARKVDANKIWHRVCQET